MPAAGAETGQPVCQSLPGLSLNLTYSKSCHKTEFVTVFCYSIISRNCFRFIWTFRLLEKQLSRYNIYLLADKHCKLLIFPPFKTIVESEITRRSCLRCDSFCSWRTKLLFDKLCSFHICVIPWKKLGCNKVHFCHCMQQWISHPAGYSGTWLSRPSVAQSHLGVITTRYSLKTRWDQGTEAPTPPSHLQHNSFQWYT